MDHLGLVVWSRIETPSLTTIRELRNVVKVEPDRTAFDIPRGYKVIRNALPPSSTAESLSPIPSKLPR